jgi:hypothetical protein
MKMGAAGKVVQRLPFALLGAGVGAGEAALTKPPEEAAKRVQEVESQPEGFGQSLRLARAKSQLSQAEHLAKHPIGGTAARAATGALIGGMVGPGAWKMFKGRLGETRSHLDELSGLLRR